MVSLGVVIAALAYALSYYTVSFWVVIACVTNGLLGVLWAIGNPYGYTQKMEAAGVQTDWFNPWRHVRGLIYTKAITVPIMSLIAWHVGQKAGYF
jgi:hypothetical protein